MEIVEKARTYDVCIVGSGAGGGMAAKVLTEAGADTVLLEAGPWWDTARWQPLALIRHPGLTRTWDGGGARIQLFGQLSGWQQVGERVTLLQVKLALRLDHDRLFLTSVTGNRRSSGLRSGVTRERQRVAANRNSRSTAGVAS